RSDATRQKIGVSEARLPPGAQDAPGEAFAGSSLVADQRANAGWQRDVEILQAAEHIAPEAPSADRSPGEDQLEEEFPCSLHEPPIGTGGWLLLSRRVPPGPQRHVASRLEESTEASSRLRVPQVKSTDIRALTKSEMESMGSSAGAQWKVSAPAEEEKECRKVQKVVLENLDERNKLGRGRKPDDQQTSTPSQKVPQQPTSRPPRKKYGKRKGVVRRSTEKREASGSPPVGAESEDASCGDKSQVHTTSANAQAERQIKASRRSSACHDFPTLSGHEGEKEGKAKAQASTAKSLRPTVLEEGACANDGQIAPSRPPGLIPTVPIALNAEAQDTWTKTLATRSLCSAVSGNAEDPGEGPSKPGAQWKVSAPAGEEKECRKVQKVVLEKLDERKILGRGRKPDDQQTSTPSQKVPQQLASRPPRKKYGKHKGVVWRSAGKREASGSLPVGAESEDASCGDKSQVHTPSANAQAERQIKASRRSSTCHDFPTLSGHEGEKEGKAKAQASTAKSLRPTVLEEGACANDGQIAPSRPPGIIPTVPIALNAEAQDTWTKTLATRSLCSALSGNAEDPGEGPSKPDRIRKLQAALCSKGLQEHRPPAKSMSRNPIRKAKMAGGKLGGQLASMALTQEPPTVERGMMVWFKFQDHPFW
ncbi:PREDICTED: serine/arginine repetitive matrix protein 2-like, partial [Galeopterus variegatus]|uniref:Serine/arginine repetitive matrix protein 2-like n=1 Tax=Galeopterus variegatus TaxID=482537 RepID=A0ABM0Q3I0_GALVR